MLEFCFRRVLGAVVLCSSSCVSGELASLRRDSRPVELDSIPAGQADLALCLESLGAPHAVREHVDGAVLAWGWADERSFGVAVTVPLSHSQHANVSFAHRLEGLQGAVLFFDHDWQLTEVREGYLAQTLPAAPVRSSAVD